MPPRPSSPSMTYPGTACSSGNAEGTADGSECNRVGAESIGTPLLPCWVTRVCPWGLLVSGPAGWVGRSEADGVSRDGSGISGPVPFSAARAPGLIISQESPDATGRSGGEHRRAEIRRRSAPPLHLSPSVGDSRAGAVGPREGEERVKGDQLPPPDAVVPRLAQLVEHLLPARQAAAALGQGREQAQARAAAGAQAVRRD